MELNREKRFVNALEFGEELIGLLKKITQKRLTRSSSTT